LKGAHAAAQSLVSPTKKTQQEGEESSGMMEVEHALCCLEAGWLYMIQVCASKFSRCFVFIESICTPSFLK